MHKRIIPLILVIMMVMSLVGCDSGAKESSDDIYIPEETIEESFVEENTLTEDNISAELILENFKDEDVTYELVY